MRRRQQGGAGEGRDGEQEEVKKDEEVGEGRAGGKESGKVVAIEKEEKEEGEMWIRIKSSRSRSRSGMTGIMRR